MFRRMMEISRTMAFSFPMKIFFNMVNFIVDLFNDREVCILKAGENS